MRPIATQGASPREISEALNQLAGGRFNNGYEATLTPNSATSVLPARGMAQTDGICFCPMTANAAAALSGLYFTAADVDVDAGTVTVTHANNAQVDKTFRYFFFATRTA